MLLNKKFILLIAFVCLFLCIITMQDTYAKYTSAINETTDIAIARWRILVNDFDIRSSSSTENLIEPVFSGNSNIASGVIAPTATGYFTIEVDATGTDLAFTYNISVDNSLDSPVSDIIVNRCVLNQTQNSNGTELTVTDGVVSGTIGLSDQRVNTFTFYIEWDDGVNQTMNNAADTATTLLEDSTAKVSVTANFTQIGNATPTPTPTATPEPGNEPDPEPTPTPTPEPSEP